MSARVGVIVVGHGSTASELLAAASGIVSNDALSGVVAIDAGEGETQAFCEQLCDAISREEHDFLIVIAHAGNEFYELPSPRTKRLYRSLVDLGADAVVSHHTHAFSGYETYRSKPIFYGLGNFLYDWPGKRNESWNRGYVVRLSMSDRIGFEIIPLKQCDEKAGVFRLNDQEQEAFLKEVERLNGIIADDRQLEASFQAYCEKVFPMYDAFLEPYFGKGITALRKRGFFPRLLSARKRLLYLNLIRCESHREVLLRLLKKNE